MNHPDYDLMIATERRKDEMAAAEHSRAVKAALAARRMNAARTPSARVPSRVGRLSSGLVLSLARFLSSVGARLLTWSCRMQTRIEQFRDEVTEKQPGPCSETISSAAR